MKKLIALMVGCAALAAPAHAASNRTSINLVAVVPVSCEVDFVNGMMIGRQIVINVRRRCNTGHRLVFNGGPASDLGKVTMRFNSQELDMGGGAAALEQAERYYNGIDQIVIEASSGSLQDLERFASALSIDIDTA